MGPIITDLLIETIQKLLPSCGEIFEIVKMFKRNMKLTRPACWITETVVQRCSIKKVFFEISQNSQENTCTRISFLSLWHRCFPVNFEKFLRKPFFIEHLWWLLLESSQKLATETAALHSWHCYDVTIVGHYYAVVIIMLRFTTSWSCLKLTFQTKPALHLCDPFFINKLNVTANSIWKYCSVLLNVKLHLLVRFKTVH